MVAVRHLVIIHTGGQVVVFSLPATLTIAAMANAETINWLAMVCSAMPSLQFVSHVLQQGRRKGACVWGGLTCTALVSVLCGRKMHMMITSPHVFLAAVPDVTLPQHDRMEITVRSRWAVVALQFGLLLGLSLPMPFLLHRMLEGGYTSGSRTFWVGSVSTTVPYLFLFLLTLFDCFLTTRLQKRCTWPLYSFLVAWTGMMALTGWIIGTTTKASSSSSTLGIAGMLTPVIYLILGVPLYLIARALFLVGGRGRP